jgi:tetratricopeptide (TPR) repeat protein
MPSLNELREFKASFSNVGGQKAALAAKKIPFDDLELPGSEPEPIKPPEPPAPKAPAPKAPAEDTSEKAAAIEPEAPASPLDGLDFSAFLDTQAHDLPEPPAADIPDHHEAEEPTVEPAAAETATGESAAELYAPEELLSNLSEELDAIPPDFPEEQPPTDDAPGLDLDSLDNFDFSDELPPQSNAKAPDPDADIDGLDNFDLLEGALSAESPSAEGQDSPPDDGASQDIVNFDELDLPANPFPLDEESSDDEADLESTGDLLSDLDFHDEPASDEGGEAPDADSIGDLLSDLDDFPASEPPLESDAPPDADSIGDLLSDLDLPTDAVPPDETESLDLDGLDGLDLSDDATPADDNDSLDLDNFGDFGLPDDAAPADGSDSLDLDNFGDFGLPDEGASADGGDNLDLDNFGDFGLPAEEAAADGSDNLDLDNFGDLGLPDEGASADGDDNLDIDNFGDLGLPDEGASGDGGDNLDIDNFGDLGLPDEGASADGGDNLDIDNFGDLGLPDEGASGDGGDILDDEAGASAEPAGVGEIDLGNFDDFDTPEAAPAASTGDSEAIDDFSFPELDVAPKKAQKAAKVVAAPKDSEKGKAKGKPKKHHIESADIDEISLSDEEFESLLETLSSYPLNLRVACEEIIAEHAVNPKQLSELLEHLVWGATAKETAIVAGRILNKTITIPKAFQKSTGAQLEAEQASFAYVFVHKFLPLLRIIMFIAIVGVSVLYLIYNFIYIPHKAEELYKTGYERIFAGEYERANKHFSDAFKIHRKKDWFYRYAEAFRDERQYIYAEQKYEELLRHYPRDKKGVLDHAYMQTHYLRNYKRADDLLREELLDYNPDDLEGLLAAGDNSLMWGEIEPSKFDDARFHYARALQKHGWKGPIVERMMRYFIRTDNLKEVLPLKEWFDYNPKETLSAESLGELGGYLLDKKLEEVQGVPNEYVEHIDGVRDILLKAVFADPSLPEPHYHLARYYQSLGNAHEERVTLRVAARAFDNAPEGSIRRINYHIDTLQRYADALINVKEFFPAEEQLIKGINIYEDAVSRRLISRSPKYGRLYAGLGDLEYFTKTDAWESALRYYHRAEQNGWATPEMQYRMGAAYYHFEDWRNALEYMFNASKNLPLNRRLLFAMGNAALKRGDYFAAQGYYTRLLDILESQRVRMPLLLPNDQPEFLELAERLMQARNNAGVANEMLSSQTGDRRYYSRAMGLYAEASRAWDTLYRDPQSMIRSPSTPLPYLNSRNALYPQQGFEPQIFIRIDREAREDSPWEALAPILRLDHGLSN